LPRSVITSQLPSGAALQVGHARLPHDFGAADLRGFGVGVRHAVGVDVTLDGIVHRALEMFLVHQRKELRGLVHRNDFQIHPEVAAARLGHLQPVDALARPGEHDAAGDVHTAGLARDLLDLLVEIDRVLLQFRDVRVAVDRVHAAGGVPGRARGQLRALDQQHVFPAGLGQVIKNARADHAAADDDDFRMAFMRPPVLRIEFIVPLIRWKPPNAPPAARARHCRSARSATTGTARSPCRPILPGCVIK
jgi:hypothetical protein